MKCVPQAKFDSWGHYQWVGDYDQTPEWANTYVSSQKIGVLKSVLDQVSSHILNSSPELLDDELDEWFEEKFTVNAVHVNQLQAVEDFCEKRRVAKLGHTADSKISRKAFYEAQAKSLDPPIDLEVLKDCASYKRAVSISRAPVDLARSWRTLLPKIKLEAVAIVAERAEAEKIREAERLREADELIKRNAEQEVFLNEISQTDTSGGFSMPGIPHSNSIWWGKMGSLPFLTRHLDYYTRPSGQN